MMEKKWLSYVVRRIFSILISLFFVSTLTFIVIHSIPGDPFSQENAIPEEVLASLKKHYGLDKPLYVQYGKYLNGILHGDLGPSFKYEYRTVNQIIKEGFPVSFHLGMQALILAVCLGICLGTIAACKRNHFTDRFVCFCIVLGVSVPSFILATFLQYLMGLQLHLLPIARWGSFEQTILPTIALAALPMVFIAKITRSKMSEVFEQDFVLTAKVKGLPYFQVIIRHVLRNSLLPLLTYLGPLTASIITGSFVIEKIFAIPGLGSWFVSSVVNRDYTTIMGVTIFYSAILMFCVLIVDLLYSRIDPRIELEQKNVF